MAPIGRLFPSGGRVEPEQMIDREGDVAEIVFRLREGVHCLLAGPRRIGKSTVCNAACVTLRSDHGFLMIWLEAPKESTATGFCQLLIDRCTRIDLARLTRRGAKALLPTIEGLLGTLGVPLDLGTVAGDLPSPTRRKTLELPLRIARQHNVSVVFCIDELQRPVDYVDGVGLVADLVDIYAGQSDVVLLVNGSHERAINQLVAEPYAVGKLAKRVDLPATIPVDQWRAPLRARFLEAGVEITDAELSAVLEFGRCRPYETMTAALNVAMTARKLELGAVDEFCVREGLRQARDHLDDDG